MKKNIRSIAATAAAMAAADYIVARRQLEERRRAVRKVFAEVDVLLAPTVKYVPRTIEEELKREIEHHMNDIGSLFEREVSKS
jgi:Asp-tRNA(Asn)/Glu-tRNA(Gln) amidotransferase A subunit family amidase